MFGWRRVRLATECCGGQSFHFASIWVDTPDSQRPWRLGTAGQPWASGHRREATRTTYRAGAGAAVPVSLSQPPCEEQRARIASNGSVAGADSQIKQRSAHTNHSSFNRFSTIVYLPGALPHKSSKHQTSGICLQMVWFAERVSKANNLSQKKKQFRTTKPKKHQTKTNQIKPEQKWTTPAGGDTHTQTDSSHHNNNNNGPGVSASSRKSQGSASCSGRPWADPATPGSPRAAPG